MPHRNICLAALHQLPLYALALMHGSRCATAGSKIKVTSIIHMAWELAALLLAYQVGPTQLPVDLWADAIAVSPSA